MCVIEYISSPFAVGWLGIPKISLWKHFSLIFFRIVLRGHYLQKMDIFAKLLICAVPYLADEYLNHGARGWTSLS